MSFTPGFQEIAFALLIGLIVFGPKRLPELARNVAKGMRFFRKAMNEARDEIKSGLELDDLDPPGPLPKLTAADLKEPIIHREETPSEDEAPADETKAEEGNEQP